MKFTRDPSQIQYFLFTPLLYSLVCLSLPEKHICGKPAVEKSHRRWQGPIDIDPIKVVLGFFFGSLLAPLTQSKSKAFGWMFGVGNRPYCWLFIGIPRPQTSIRDERLNRVGSIEMWFGSNESLVWNFERWKWWVY